LEFCFHCEPPGCAVETHYVTFLPLCQGLKISVITPNSIVGSSRARILSEILVVLSGNGKVGHIPMLWDGRASLRITELFRGFFLTCG